MQRGAFIGRPVLPYGPMTPLEYTFDLPVVDDLLPAIGMIAVEWSRLDSVNEGAIGTTGYMTEGIAEAVA